MNTIQTITCFILAISVLVSYYFFLQTDEKYEGGYAGHPFWFGIPKNIVVFLIFFQLLAVIGFCVSIGLWLKNPPTSGACKDDKLFYALILFFISAICWPIFIYYKLSYLTVLSLVFTAAASIWLLAGAIEEDDNDTKIYKVMGLFFLCTVTVLGDGVIWNANYVIKNKNLF
jgi:hypothetical protein